MIREASPYLSRVHAELDYFNSAATAAAGNTVAGDLQDHNNCGPTQVFNNLIQGVLSCNQNTSITGALDTAREKQGQCASF